MIEQILQADRYLQVDQVERARETYQRVVDADPGNAIAVVGLARCALAESEDADAYELASRALEIDPENDMARRMEARLSEILTSRGQAVARPAAAGLPGPREMRPVVAEPDGAEPDGAEPDGAEPTASATPDVSAGARRPAPEPTSGPGQPRPAARPTPEPAGPAPPPSATTKERPVRKSLIDRLLGR